MEEDIWIGRIIPSTPHLLAWHGMAQILSYSRRNLCRIFPESTFDPFHKRCMSLPRDNIFGVRCSCKGGVLRKGKTIPITRVLCIDMGQQSMPTGTSKMISDASYSCQNHYGFIIQGTTKM
jgi:hypothetical protein